jgi:hypothetical protein
LKPDIDEDRFRTMNSMRNVDAQAGIFLLGRRDNLDRVGCKVKENKKRIGTA